MKKQKVALITGANGQSGSFLAEFLLDKGYKVVGMVRRSSSPNYERLKAALENCNFEIRLGEVTDVNCVRNLIEDIGPDEVYNLAAQSHVHVSFDQPAWTTQTTYLGCLNCLEAIRGRPEIRFYQASSSEMFGDMYSIGDRHYSWKHRRWQNQLECEYACQSEETPMHPCSPYAVAKLAAHHLCRIYRDSYGVFVCSGILYNHESGRRPEAFVTRKITKYVAKYAEGLTKGKLKLGNLYAYRDWSHARDMVRGMWMMLQQPKPDDYVLASGKCHSVYDFLIEAFKCIGVSKDKVEDLFEIDPKLYRPCEVPMLRGDACKARKVLGWEPETSFEDLVKEMVEADLADLPRQRWNDTSWK